MIDLFFVYFTNTLNISLFILLLLIVEPFLRNNYSTACLYRIWVVLLIGLLIPMRFEITKPLFYLGLPRISVEANADNDFIAPESYDTGYIPPNTNLSVQLNQFKQNSAPDSSKSILTYFFKQLLPPKLHMITQNRYLILVLLWMIGATFLLSYNGILYYRYKMKLMRFLVPIHQEDILEEFDQAVLKICGDNHQHYISGYMQCKNATLCKCAVISSPMTIGIFKPTVLLPDIAYTRKELHYLLHHELIHIRRRDSFVKLIRLIALSLNWFNPLCYVMLKRLEYWCETSCDEIVLGKSSKSECMYYSKLLLKCADTQTKQNSTLFTHFYGGKNNMKQRLLLILKRSKKRSGRVILALFLSILSTTAFFTINNKDGFASDDIETVTDTCADKTLEDDMNDNSVSVDITVAPSNSNVDLFDSEPTKNEADVSTTNGTSDADLLREKLVSYAQETEGSPYLWGGTDISTGVDCSGLVQTLYKKIGYDLPRTSEEQLSACEEVSVDNLLPGDLVFYETTCVESTYIIHVGIYIGDGQIIHATNARVGVAISDMNYRTPYCGGRVIVD